MAKRVRNTALQVEHKGSSNYLREENLALMVESKGTSNYLRVRTIALMMEYTGTPVATPTMTQGPKWQVMA
jgi:hypothetical protein